MKFKTKYAKEGFEKIEKGLQEIVHEIDCWFSENFAYEITITETMTDLAKDKKEGRVSDTHRTGRAVDIRTKDWNRQMFDAFLLRFSYLDAFGAVGIESNQRRALVFKPHGSAPHLHLQIGKDMIKTLSDQN